MRIFSHPDYAREWALADRLGESVNTDCFHMGYDKPEYALAVVFEVYEEEEGR